MTNEELDIKARQHAKDYSGANWATARESYIAGFKEAEEKPRWIPVNERLPEIRKEEYKIIVKNQNGDIQEFEILNNMDLEMLQNWCTHWKEII